MPKTLSKPWTYALPAALVLMAPFDLLASLAMDVYLPVVTTMPAALETTPAVIQLTLSLYMIVLGVGQLAFGPLSDRIGRRPVLIGGAALFAATSFAMAATSSATVFVGLRLMQAAGASAMLVALYATVRDVYASRPEGAVIYSILNAILAFVPALGPLVGAAMARLFGWPGIFVALGALAASAAFQGVLRWPETRPAERPGRQERFRPVLVSKAFWTYALGSSAAMGSFFVFFSTAPRVLMGRAGYSELEFSLAFATAAVVMIVVSPFAKGIAARWGIPGALARGMVLMILGAGLLAAAQLLFHPSFWSFVLPVWVIAVGIVFAASVTPNGALVGFADNAGTAVALLFCVESIFIGAAATPMIVLLGGDTAWPLITFSTLAGLLTLAALGRLQASQEQRKEQSGSHAQGPPPPAPGSSGFA